MNARYTEFTHSGAEFADENSGRYASGSSRLANTSRVWVWRLQNQTTLALGGSNPPLPTTSVTQRDGPEGGCNPPGQKPSLVRFQSCRPMQQEEQINQLVVGRTIKRIEVEARNSWCIWFTDGSRVWVESDTFWTPAGDLSELDMVKI